MNILTMSKRERKDIEMKMRVKLQSRSTDDINFLYKSVGFRKIAGRKTRKGRINALIEYFRDDYICKMNPTMENRLNHCIWYYS